MAAPIGNRPQGEKEVTATETRPVADEYVYCKGCGTQLELRSRLSRPKAQVDKMMCQSCIDIHGHPLVPSPGAPTFCYRCGGPEDVFEAPGISPAIYHICPACLPERYERYRQGDFETPPKVVPTEETPSPSPQGKTA